MLYIYSHNLTILLKRVYWDPRRHIATSLAYQLVVRPYSLADAIWHVVADATSYPEQNYFGPLFFETLSFFLSSNLGNCIGNRAIDTANARTNV